MALTPYVPTACNVCNRTWLAAPFFERASTCQFCQGPAHVVPGESYRADDIPLFDRIESTISAAQPSEQVSRRLWVTLSDVSQRSLRPQDLLAAVVDELPGLQFLIDAFANDRAQLGRGVGMILAVLSVHLATFEGSVLSLTAQV
jgi:hypothetical protein